MFVLDTAAMPWDPVKANTRTGKISRGVQTGLYGCCALLRQRPQQ